MPATASADYKLLAAHGEPKLVHLVHHTAKWHTAAKPTGGMGGDPALGYDSVCGKRGMPMWQDSTDLELCGECADKIPRSVTAGGA